MIGNWFKWEQSSKFSQKMLTIAHFFVLNAKAIVASKFWAFGAILHFIAFVLTIGVAVAEKASWNALF